MEIQKCPLCLEDKNVVLSHLIPAALYNYCRTENASPVRVGDGVVMHTDRQIQAYLLCRDCEEILNKGGETWTNNKLARITQKFPLYDLLVREAPAFEGDEGALYYAAQNPEIDVERLTHFALGIFWKASVHSWRANEKSPLIELGTDSNSIRTWLLHETSFPKDVFLTVSLSRPKQALITIHAPVESNPTNWRSFLLYVPGVQFLLSTGKQIDIEMRETCFHESAEHPVFVSDDLTRQLWSKLGEQYIESRKTRRYLKAKAERSKAVKS